VERVIKHHNDMVDFDFGLPDSQNVATWHAFTL
jgi:hypothetical protein